MMHFSASVLGSLSLLLFSFSSFHPVEGRRVSTVVRRPPRRVSTVVRLPRDLAPDDHEGNCHGDPECDECSCDDDTGVVRCDNPFADLAIYECQDGDVEGIGCHCDGNTIHCEGMKPEHPEDEDSHSSHEDECHCDSDVPHCKDTADEAEYAHKCDDHDDHEGECHCDGDVPHCKDAADEADYDCEKDDHADDDCHCDDGVAHCKHTEDEAEHKCKDHEDDKGRVLADDGDCHCDDDVPHCKDAADEADYDCEKDDHDGDCHCDDGVAHCKHAEDEAEYKCKDKDDHDDHHDDDNKKEIEEADYYCLAGDIHGMPKECKIDTQYLYKKKAGQDCMNWVALNPTKYCKKKEIMKKCGGICHSLRCQNTKKTKYCRDYNGKLKFKVKQEDGTKKKMKMKCKQIKKEGLCKKKYKGKMKFLSYCPVQCKACLMLAM